LRRLSMLRGRTSQKRAPGDLDPNPRTKKKKKGGFDDCGKKGMVGEGWDGQNTKLGGKANTLGKKKGGEKNTAVTNKPKIDRSTIKNSRKAMATHSTRGQGSEPRGRKGKVAGRTQ